MPTSIGSQLPWLIWANVARTLLAAILWYTSGP
jgi:hypothetical protein